VSQVAYSEVFVAVLPDRYRSLAIHVRRYRNVKLCIHSTLLLYDFPQYVGLGSKVIADILSMF
jgi:hypothetical protein